MHLGHLHRINLLVIDIEFTSAAELLGLDKVELDIDLALSQRRRLQQVMYTVQEVVIVIESAPEISPQINIL